MRPLSGWRQRVVDAVYVASEAVAWFMAIRLVASVMEAGFLDDVAMRLDHAVRSGQIADASRARDTIALIEATGTQVHGPNVLVVMIAAFAAFWLIRLVFMSGLEGGLGAAALLFGSVLGLNVMLHLGLGGDLRFWDTSGLGNFLANPDQYFAGRLDLDAFVADPRLEHMHGAALATTFWGLGLVWLRFLIAGRRTIGFDRVLRSFTLGFVAVLLMVVAARLAGVEGLTRYAVPHFVLGALALAAANNARAAAPTEGERRIGPWAIAVGGTLAVLVAMALLLGLLAYLNVGAVLSFIGGVALQILTVLLIVVLTPIFWLIDTVLRFFFPEGVGGMFDELVNFEMVFEDAEEEALEEGGVRVAGWLVNTLKLFAVLILGFMAYRIALIIVGARRRYREAVEEVRSHTGSGGAGFGELLRDLLPGGRQRARREWLRRHRIYALYAHSVDVAGEHGLSALPGETPIEFGRASARLLGAPVPPIAQAFDRARYGRHYPEEPEVREMASTFLEWEQTHPATEEERTRLQGARPIEDADQIALRIAQAKRQARGDIERGRIDL